jgi:RNA polymerase sigma factor (sigma-70 family)
MVNVQCESLQDEGVQPFEEVVAEHGAVVMRVCRALLPPADAEDAWAETFVAALRAYPDLRPGSNVRGWLVTIAHRKSIDAIRATGRRAVPTAEVPEVSTPAAEWSDDHAELVAALAALPAKQRGAVVYHHLAGLPYREVGRVLECSEAAARRSAADGIANLRARFPELTHPGGTR